MPKSNVIPLSQQGRIPCSLPLADADLSLGNANWAKGLQAMSDWIWSGNLNPVAFPNNLARYFLQIPGIFEQQLNFSTTLIFDEPSFRNGIQMSGFVDRVCRELVISFIAQKRHCWYSMTHHAVLGYLTAKKHGLSESEYEEKWSKLTDYANTRGVYTDLEFAALEFADAFTSDPKTYSAQQFDRLCKALAQYNESSYLRDGRWMQQLQAARCAQALAMVQGKAPEDVVKVASAAASNASGTVPPDLNKRNVNAQIVELAFLCLQFVALTGVFSALNIPDEEFLPSVMQNLLPAPVIQKINDFCAMGSKNLPRMVPDPVYPPIDAIERGDVEVEPAPLKGSRVPLNSYELGMNQDLDKGLTVGGVQVGVYGWSFGFHFPGSLVYCLMLHPELARYEAPYSLPLLFNEDEWRNGTQTAGFTSRLLKEIVYQKIYKTTRSRYGLEHHTMFLYNSYLDLYGVGRAPNPTMTPAEQQTARALALEHAEAVVLYTQDHQNSAAKFSQLEKATLSWVLKFITAPHDAWNDERQLRQELDRQNRLEVKAGIRRLDGSDGVGEDAAFRRLLDHQIAELAMLTGHMDGLGRVLTILRLVSEDPVQIVDGQLTNNGIQPTLNNGVIQPTGYFNTRPGLLQLLKFTGVGPKALTVNELTLNPTLNDRVIQDLKSGKKVKVSANVAAQTGEF